jgi:hypothetical protein
VFGLGLLIGVLNLASGEVIQANVCPKPATPVIVLPVDGSTTGSASQLVEGTAGHNVAVAILDNDQLVASVTSDGSGDFAGTIQLVGGSNRIVARVTNDCSQIADSAPSVVTYTPTVPPYPPITPPPIVVPITSTSTPITIVPAVIAPTAALSGTGLKLTVTAYAGTDTTTTIPVGQSVTLDSIFVTGSTGVPANVVVVLNGKVIADLVSDRAGHFGLIVPLAIGENKIQFIATLGDQKLVKTLDYTRTAIITKIGPGGYFLLGAELIAVFVVLVIPFLRRRKAQANEGEEKTDVTKS